MGCDFNRSTQHLISNYREDDVENEATTEDLLHRSGYSAAAKFNDVTNRKRLETDFHRYARIDRHEGA